MKDNLFSDKNFCRKLFQLTLPIALQSLMLASVAAADAVMLGSVDQNSMSGVSLATQIQFIQNMILSAVVSAAAILGAQYWGKATGRRLTISSVSVCDIAGRLLCCSLWAAFFSRSILCCSLLMKRH